MSSQIDWGSKTLTAEEKAQVVRWMIENKVGPKAAKEHFGLSVDVRTIQIWRQKFADGAPIAASPREHALDLLAGGALLTDVAQRLGVRVTRIESWIVAWANDHTAELAAERFGVPLVALREWMKRDAIPDLLLTENGSIRGIFENATKILDHIQDQKDPLLSLRHNLFTGGVEIRAPGTSTWSAWDDSHLRKLKQHLSDEHMCQVPRLELQQAVLLSAEGTPHHPVREYLEALSWDGHPRLDRLLDWYFGCELDGLSATMGRKWLVSAIARVMRPPCKVDTVLVLHGAQGVGKSTAFRALSNPWFTDVSLDLNKNADTAMSIRGRWFVELAELDSLSKADTGAIKAFISRETDHYRAPYGHNFEDVPRQSILVGSTNEAQFLVDHTGNRRFWVRRVVRPIRTVEIEAARDQLWAEALEAYHAGETWWLTGEEQALANEANRAFEWSDAWTEPLEAWLARNLGATPTSAELFEHALRIPLGSIGVREERRIAKVMRALDWEQTRPRSGTSRARRWVRVPRVDGR